MGIVLSVLSYACGRRMTLGGNAIAGGERTRGGNLFLGAGGIPLVDQQLGKFGADRKGGRIFRLGLRVKVLLEQLDGGLRFQVRLDQVRGAVDQRRAVVRIQRGAGVDRGHHIVIAFAKDARSIQGPAGFDDCAIAAL
jgi:hypothetical protein